MGFMLSDEFYFVSDSYSIMVLFLGISYLKTLRGTFLNLDSP